MHAPAARRASKQAQDKGAANVYVKAPGPEHQPTPAVKILDASHNPLGAPQCLDHLLVPSLSHAVSSQISRYFPPSSFGLENALGLARVTTP